jgi:hypothetical protein
MIWIPACAGMTDFRSNEILGFTQTSRRNARWLLRPTSARMWV